jgi:hypothetical protein
MYACKWVSIPRQSPGQSHMTPKCPWRGNRMMNETESKIEHLDCFRSNFPNFSPYAIALRQSRGL